MFDERIELQLRRYMALWGMDSQDEIDQLQARTARGALTVFWMHYRRAKTRAQKRDLLRFPWVEHFQAQEKNLFENRYLSRTHRLQMRAIHDQTIWLLDGICSKVERLQLGW